MPVLSANKPVDVATQETFTFLSSHLADNSEVIEVGCGDGEVAAELVRCGHRIMALDSEEDRIAKARARGVKAVVASWPEFDHHAVDAIAFTRSLHHINPLDGAIGKARELLKASGQLLIEDFAFGEVEENTVHWFVRWLRSEPSLIKPVEDQLATRLLSARDPMAVWHESHDHDLHSIAAIADAIAKRFTIRETQSVPYLYRYLIAVLPETKAAAVFVQRVLDEEAAAGKRDEIALMGRRIIATPR